ncbi:MAG: hypothetical protein LBT88_01865 [Oscillospiraceae bacterium]|jgi:hypothetical protein|nr:hypothetical protein [Oscillospiraceae bacterium]
MKIARVFPRRTSATPDDELAFINCSPPMLTLPEIDEVHISVAFTWDKPRAEPLALEWEITGVPVKLGGPAYNEPGGDFVPGRYLKQGYVITSRGCPNHCWFCSVPKREGGTLRELPITEGWKLLDDNILATSETHFRAVMRMLRNQSYAPILSGGLEAARLKDWQAELLAYIKPKEMFFAYDTPDDYEPLVEAGKILQRYGFTTKDQRARAYVLIGYQGDTVTAAEKRLRDTWEAGFLPFAMLYRDENAAVKNLDWAKFQRLWSRPVITVSKLINGT